MGTPILSRRTAWWWRSVLLLAAAACDPTVAGPNGEIAGDLRIVPDLQSAVAPELLGVDAIHIRAVSEVDGRDLVDTTLAFDPTTTDTLGWLISLRNSPENVMVEASVLAGTDVMFAGDTSLAVTEGYVGSSAPRVVSVPFAGPGANVASLEVVPADSVITWDDTVRYTVVALDSSGTEVSNATVFWESSDPAVADFADGSRLEAPASGRDSVVVTALTPSGVRDSTRVWFRPAPDTIVIVTGDADSAAVDQSIPLAVQVLGADGLPLDRVTVWFAASTGASVQDTGVVTDAQGMAATTGRLGTQVGSYGFTASVGSLNAQLAAIATPGPAAALGFAAQPVDVGAGVTMAPVLVTVVDAFGNPATDDTVDVMLSLVGAPLGATLGGTVMRSAVGGTALFDDLTADAPGQDYQLQAVAAGLVSATSDLFDVIDVPVAVVITPDSVGMSALGAELQLAAAATNASGGTVLGAAFGWMSADPTVATVDSTGLVMATGNGVTQVIATSGSLSDTIPVTVQQMTATVTATPDTLRFVSLGDHAAVAASAADANGFAVAGATFTWASTDLSVAAVDATGDVSSVGDGTALVVVTAGAAEDTVVVLVRQSPTAVTVSPTNVGLTAVDDTARVTATAADANGNPTPNATFAWSTTDATVATVDGAGLITAVGNGSTLVIAAAGSAADTVSVSVQQTPVAIVVTPGAATLDALDDTLTFSAAVTDANGNPVSGPVTWSTGDASVAQIDAAGLATAVGNGTVDIIAAAGSVADTAQLTIQQVIDAVSITPGGATFSAFDATQQFSAIVSDANGNAMAVSVTWTPTAAAIVTVDQSGLATAVSNGVAAVVASAGSVADTVPVTVQQTAASVSVTPSALNFSALNDTGQLGVTATDANGNLLVTPSVTWTSADGSVATVDGTGLVTAAGNGTVQIRATVDGVADSSTVTVQQVVDAVSVSPPASTLDAIDDTEQFSVALSDANGYPVTAPVVWTSTDQGVATVDQAAGLATAVGNGVTSIVATVGALADTAALTVQQVVAGVAVTPGPATLDAFGDQQQFSAAVTDANGNAMTAAVTWSSSMPTVASIDQAGLALAGANGVTSIAAAAGSVADTVQLTVQQVATSVTVTPSALNFSALDDVAAVALAASDGNGNPIANPVVVWTTTDPSVVTVDQVGQVTAEGNGSADVVGTVDGVSDSSAAVVQQVVDAVALSPGTATLDAIDATQQFVVAVTDANGNPVVTAVLWNSTDPTVASVDQAGLALAVDNGVTSIVAAAGSAADTATLTVQQVPDQVSVSPGTATLDALGASQSFSATATDANGNPVSAAVTWSSTLPAVAGVDPAGLATAMTNGTTGIVASVGALADTATLVVQQVAAAVAVTPGSATLNAFDDQQQFAAAVTDANGNPMATPVTWSLSDSAVASIDQGGLATALDNGTTLVVAAAGPAADTVTLTVQQVVDQVTIAPDSVNLVGIGATQQFTATVTDANGYSVVGANVTWSMTVAEVISLDATGFAISLDYGITEVVATSGGVSDTAIVVVDTTLELDASLPDRPVSNVELRRADEMMPIRRPRAAGLAAD